MKITCQRDKLLEAFQTAATVAPSRSPKPILQNVRLDVTKSGALLMASDMEVGIRMEVQGIEVGVEGKALLPVARFGSILRESSDEQLKIEGRRTRHDDSGRAERVQIARRQSRRISRCADLRR